MDPFTISTLSNSKLDAALRSYGARTSGTRDRKLQRLWNFNEAEYLKRANKNFFRELVAYEQRQVTLRSRARAAEVLLETAPENNAEMDATLRRLGEDDTTSAERRCLLRAVRAGMRPNPRHIIFEEDNDVSGV